VAVVVGRARLVLKETSGEQRSNYDRPQDWLARNPRPFDKILAKTREREYATRKGRGDAAAS